MCVCALVCVCVCVCLCVDVCACLCPPLPPSASSYFRVLPRYKLRGEGDRVVVDDQIALVSVKRQLRVHVSPNPLYNRGPKFPRFEVTASQVTCPPSPSPTHCTLNGSHVCCCVVCLRNDCVNNVCVCIPVRQTDSTSSLKIVRYSGFQHSLHHYITSGTVVRLFHTEAEVCGRVCVTVIVCDCV